MENITVKILPADDYWYLKQYWKKLNRINSRFFLSSKTKDSLLDFHEIFIRTSIIKTFNSVCDLIYSK
jgi:hypothetical protein